eukprot:CAMPEP_0179243740 /NCGR_PEP_ID=MMETSP0797-20121207/17701_1 /TAXON_ID=47934 /ORGANISM="Dinophysis acuminata, Strain DAEP01" /LENGTH=42 /DNA_ID= /DNA_START= /DNA_END= /DNA_ORIENTATION=
MIERQLLKLPQGRAVNVLDTLKVQRSWPLCPDREIPAVFYPG